MKALGIVRHIDDLGRVVIPAEVRKVNGWKAGTPVEMLATENGLFINEYKSDLEKKALLDSLYEVYQSTENEAAYEIIGRAIDFVKKG
ncbi:AbrB/MazE/SpoVT family DNA-binding domain-containing protein [Neobacillus drentensis]|uniref:AbrB/MazE/SpoVT family DNA-binding domain-containing protein n=1 Tax=Neobacillus drentensis TaxID=220684 RepID=UPI001F22B3DF|nr:AbrB/MazE/SpoVT family DNA-binding domain-containing protein [Neobacillus drentensis]ULT55423.1 AbrB/MazE/SpoVT family DNA-binding domain-containing protein [Neobacillus drentensis]